MAGLNYLITESELRSILNKNNIIFDTYKCIVSENNRNHQMKIDNFQIYIEEDIINDNYKLHIFPKKKDCKYFSQFKDCDELIENLILFINLHKSNIDSATIRPRKEWIGERIGEIEAAIDFNKEHNISIPDDWFIELNTLLDSINI